MPHAQGIGAIFGIVAEDGVAKQNSPVNLYDRSNGQLVRRTYTNDDGGYTFGGLDPFSSDYMVLATDEDGSPRKNAIVYDRITPVPAASGTIYDSNWQAVAMKYHAFSLAAGKRPSANATWAATLPGDYAWAAWTDTGNVQFGIDALLGTFDEREIKVR